MPEIKKQSITVGTKYQKPTPEKSSKAKAIEASGQFVAPQKSKTIPSAAPKVIGILKNPATRAPKVAPIKRVGIISPPLKPVETQMKVKISFNKKASGRKLIEFGLKSPLKMFSIIFTPAPL